MTFKIKKYQSGGGLIVTPYQPVVSSGGISPRVQMELAFMSGEMGGGNGTTSSGNSKDSLTEKGLFDLYSELKDSGLASDTQLILRSIQNEIFNVDLLDPFGSSTSNLASKYLKAINYINLAKQNKEAYDKAYEQVDKKNALSEAAITADGRVAVKDKTNKIQLVSVEEYRKNPSSYIIQTNDNLLSARKNNPLYAFNHSLIDITNNATSFKDIVDTIHNFVSTLGNNSVVLQGYTEKQRDTIIKGIGLLQSAALKFGAPAIEDLFSNNGVYESKLDLQNSKKQIEYALVSLLAMLPENQKTLLKLKTKNGTDEDMIKLLGYMLEPSASTKNSFTADLIEGVDSAGNSVKGSKSSSSKEQDDSKSSFIVNVQKGGGGANATVVLNQGSKAQLSSQGTQYGQILTPDSKGIGKTSLEEMLQASNLQSVTDPSQIYFGDQKVKRGNLKDITFEDESAYRVILPAVQEGALWRPDFDILKKYEEVCDKVRQEGHDPHDRNDAEGQKLFAELMMKADLYEYVTNGLPNWKKLRPFLVTQGRTTSRSGVHSSDWVEEIDDWGERRVAREEIEEILSTKGPDGKVKKYSTDSFNALNPLDWGFGLGSFDRVFRSTIYIPINYNELQGMTASGQNIKSNYANIREQEYLRTNRRVNAGKVDSELLGI